MTAATDVVQCESGAASRSVPVEVVAPGTTVARRQCQFACRVDRQRSVCGIPVVKLVSQQGDVTAASVDALVAIQTNPTAVASLTCPGPQKNVSTTRGDIAVQIHGIVVAAARPDRSPIADHQTIPERAAICSGAAACPEVPAVGGDRGADCNTNAPRGTVVGPEHHVKWAAVAAADGRVHHYTVVGLQCQRGGAAASLGDGAIDADAADVIRGGGATVACFRYCRGNRHAACVERRTNRTRLRRTDRVVIRVDQPQAGLALWGQGIHV